jgi:hypothetical protein
MFATRAAPARVPAPPGRASTLASARGSRPPAAARIGRASRRRGVVARAADFDLDALMPDSIEGDLEGLQEEAGATFDDDGLPLEYGDVDAELAVLTSEVGIVDRGAVKWRLLRLGGPAAVPALEAAGASRDAIEALLASGPGEGAAVAFKDGEDGCTRTAMLHVQAGGLLVVAPEPVADALLAAGGADAADLAERCALLSLVGPDAAALLAKAGVSGVMDQPLGAHRTFGFEERPVVATHGGAEMFVSFDKRTKTLACANLIVDEGVAGLLWAAMTSLGAKPAGTDALERWARENA